MRGWRRGMVLGIAVSTALLTPSQDPFTFLAMAVPLYLLYESCIVVARLLERSRRGRVAVEPGSEDLELLGDDETSFVDDRPSVLEPVPGAATDRDVT
jgi:sec-independent protein translocase protein TatC